MKEILLKKDIIRCLQNELDITRRKDPNDLTFIRDISFSQGYKEGLIQAYYNVLNYVHFGIMRP